MSLSHILLGLLEKPQSGYDLRQAFEGGAAHYWTAELSQIYPALKKLETAGHVTSTEVASQKGPSRKVYERTESGRDELVAWIRTGPAESASRLAYVGQVEFAHVVDDLAVTSRLIETLEVSFGSLHDLLVEVEADLRQQTRTSQVLHELLAVRLGLVTLRGRLEWCDDARKLLKDAS